MERSILGQSPEIQELLKLIDRVAATKANILVIGESGTGKELVARRIHNSGPLKTQAFIPVNCGAIPENLIESEMFGHQRGSFTGAVSDKMGLFEAAHKGTLFLDEVGELPLALQVKLLRAIQEKIIRRVGGLHDIPVDVRIIAATNRDLEARVKEGKFREDLYYRLNVILIRTPPLRVRKSDISMLAEQFLKKFSQKANKWISSFTPEAIAALEAYSWPGNVRELENCVERAVTLESGEEIQLNSLPISVQKFNPPSSEKVSSGKRNEIVLPGPDFTNGNVNLDEILAQAEKIYLEAAMKQVGGVKKKTADLLGITLRSLRYRVKKLGLSD